MGKQNRENLGQLISRVIRQKKLKLRDVEFKAGGKITNSYISRIMNGNVKNLTLEKLFALARGLELDPHKLFTAAYGHPPSSSVTQPKEAEIELGAVEFLTLMHKVAVNPEYVEIVKEVIQLWPEECQVMLESLTSINEKKRKSQRGKKPSRNRE